MGRTCDCLERLKGQSEALRERKAKAMRLERMAEARFRRKYPRAFDQAEYEREVEEWLNRDTV